MADYTARKLRSHYGTAYVIVEPTDTSPSSPERNAGATVITLDGSRADSIAAGIVRMVNESQCIVCGKFNGLHGEVFTKTGQDGGGGVQGFYAMCPNAPHQAGAPGK